MRCVLNGEEIELPDDLVENETIFKAVMNYDAWMSLSNGEKHQLQKFLPNKINETEEDDQNFQEDSVRIALGTDVKLKHGSPIENIYAQMKDGLLSPKVVYMKKKCHRLKYKNYKLMQKEYYKNLLQEIIVSRQAILEKAQKNGPSYIASKRKQRSEFTYPIEEKVRRKLEKIVRDVALECGDEGGSSDEESVNSSSPASTMKYKLPIKMHMSVNPSIRTTYSSAQDDITTNDFQYMISEHKKKRLVKDTNPEIDTTNISLADVIMRCNSMKKKVKGKMKNAADNQPNDIKIKPPDHSTPVNTSEKHESVEQQKVATGEKKKKDTTKKWNSSHGYPRMGSFFSLLGYIFEQKREKKCNLLQLQEKVMTWQNHESSEICGWKTLYPNWLPLLKYAIEYMTGKGKASLLHDFIPLLVPGKDNHEEDWTWAGPEHDNDDLILPLCNHWLETLSQVMGGKTIVFEAEDKDRKTIDTTRTTYIVEKSTSEQKQSFRKQEKERYNVPHKPYIYTMHGYESIVGPVKGVFSAKDASASKAREHAMLVSERPAFVTILCLVRDSVARLPNGEGTRAEVCMLLKDSQFLNPEATDSQIHSVVSGALDRLHSEIDPCVKFDQSRKLWIYLHRTRSVEEFEKIHEASAAAAQAKKQLNQSKLKAAKQKKVLNEMNELAEKTSNQKKEATPKSKKSLTTSIADKASDSTNDSRNTQSTPSNSLKSTPKKPDDSKSKPPKRKRSVNDSNTPKAPKVQKTVIKPEDELQSFFDEEAAMATQSILSDDERNDLFAFDHSDTSDLLNMDRFSGSNLDSFTEIENPIGLDSDAALNSSFQQNALSKDRKSISDVEIVNKANNSPYLNQSGYIKARSISDIVHNRLPTADSQVTKDRILVSPGTSFGSISVTSTSAMQPLSLENIIQPQKSVTLKENLLMQTKALNEQISTQANSTQPLPLEQQIGKNQVKRGPIQITISPITDQGYKGISPNEHYLQLQGGKRQNPPSNTSKQVKTVMQEQQKWPANNQLKQGQSKIIASSMSVTIGNHSTSLQTLSRFITSKVAPKIISSSQSSPHPQITLPMNISGKTAITLVQQNPYQIQVKAQARQSNPALQKTGSPRLANYLTMSKPLTNVGNAERFQMVDIKGSRGNQIIVSKPPVASPNVKKVNVLKPNVQPVQQFSLNQLIAATKGRTDLTSKQLSNIRSPTPVTSIQAMMQLSGKPNSFQKLENQMRLQRQNSNEKEQGTAKVVRIPKTLIQGKVSSPLTGAPNNLILTGGVTLGQQVQLRPTIPISQVNRPVVAPLKISLPRAAFQPGMSSPARAPSPGQSPVRLSSPGVRIKTIFNTNHAVSSSSQDTQKK